MISRQFYSGGILNTASILSRKYSKIVGSAKRWSIISLIATTAALGFPGSAFAENWVKAGKTTPITEKTRQLRKLTDYVSGISDTKKAAKTNASDILFETAVHESARLKYNRQIARDKKGNLVPGRARSIFMVEPVTAKNLVSWAKSKPKAMHLLTTTSGKTAKDLLKMTRQELADTLMANDQFAAAMARVKYLSVPGKIPSTAEARAAYWSKYYQGTDNPVKQKQYLADNRLIAEELKAAELSKVVAKHTPPGRPTQGLVNKVLHEGKVKHAISSYRKKIGSLFRTLGRR